MTIQEWLGEDNTLGKDILEKKYLQKEETLDEWFGRISGGNPKVKQLIQDKKFLFGGRILANRGLPAKGIKTTYSNCYVLSVDDSIESIYKTCGEIARTYSYGGGVGIDISKLRPRGAEVHNSAKETTGAVSFMKTFDVVTGTIGQNGRRGALMISLSVNHPDIEEFVDIKANTDQITNANISVRVTDAFMKAVKNNEDWYCTWPCERHKELEQLAKKEVDVRPSSLPYGKLIIVKAGDNYTGYVKRIKARDLFHTLAKNNWDYGEPGILYWDRITNYHLMAKDPNFEYAGVNPCAEEPLPDGGACLLGSINLAAYDNPLLDNNFADDIRTAVIGLNEVLEEGKDLHPLLQQRYSCVNYHQIGLGIMGLGDLLIKNQRLHDELLR